MAGFDGERETARALFEQNRVDQARAAYLALVERAPDDPGVLADAGTFFFRTGAYAAAQSIFERALAVEPSSAGAHLQLANVRFALGDYHRARAGYAAAVALDPARQEAHQGLSYALVRLEREPEAARHRKIGFAGRSVTTGGFRGAGRPIDVLLLVAAAGGTIYTDAILDDTIFRTTTVVVDAGDDRPADVPPHDVVFNALADADRVGPALAGLDRRFERVPGVVNPPARVMATTREANARRFGALSDVVAPRTVSLPRRGLVRKGVDVLGSYGFGFPVLVRAPGYQTGQHFVAVEAPEDLEQAIAPLPGDTLLAIEFVDTRDATGTFRKYRMMTVDGRLYPLHAAVAKHWKVHFATADMDDPAHRAEDERFLRDPRDVLGARAMGALERIRDILGLDYGGIDFALDAQGRVVVFEANATMIVLPPGPDPIWDYRRPAVERVIGATRDMLKRRAGRL